MLKKYNYIVLLILLSLAGISADAQNETGAWTLKKCIDHALQNNLSLKMQQLSLESSQITLTQSKLSMLPTLNASATHNYNWGKSVDRYTNQLTTDRIQSNNFYIGSQVTLFNGFQLLNGWKQKMIDLHAAEYDLQKLSNDIALNIATAYLQILYNTESFENAKNQLEITRLQLDKSKKMLDAGAISKGTYLSVEAQYSSEEMALVDAENNLKLSLLTLAQMLDLPNTADFAIAFPESLDNDSLLLPAQSSADIFAYAVKNQPEIMAADLRVQSAEKSLQIARGGRLPSLTLSGSFGTGYSDAGKELSGVSVSGYDTLGITTESPTEYVLGPRYNYSYSTKSFNNQIKDNSNKTIGFTLNIPLFNSWAVNSAISQSKIGLETARINRQLTEQTMQKTIEQAYADAHGAVKRYMAAKKQYQSYQESFAYNQEKFNVGLITAIDYNDAKNKTGKAKSDLLQAKYEFLFRLKILEFYLGNEIKL